MSELLKNTYKRLYPTGGAWTIHVGEDTEKLLDGIAEFEGTLLSFYDKLSVIRNPFLTDLLDELEREYGFALNSSLTDDQRRQQIDTLKKNKKDANGGLDFLQSKLHEAGFNNVYVFNNDPPVYPGDLISGVYSAWCGNPESCCGHESAFCASVELGGYIVNGPIAKDGIPYVAGCGQDTWCGNPDSYCGHFVSQFNLGFVEYTVPTDPAIGNWALVFFLAGGIDKDIDGNIVGLTPVVLDSKYEELFNTIVLRYKPLQTWAASAVSFSDDITEYGFGNNEWGNSAFGN